jgi:hypothetical protein
MLVKVFQLKENMLMWVQEYVEPDANSTIVSYNASAVKIYNQTSSLVLFENKNVFFYFETRSSLIQRWRCSCKFGSRRMDSSHCLSNSSKG